MNLRLLSLILFTVASGITQAQPVNECIREILADEKASAKLALKKPVLVNNYYTAQNYAAAFFSLNGDSIRHMLFRQLADAGSLGLLQEDYQYNYIGALQNGGVLLSTAADSGAADIRLTDAALHLLSEVHCGNKEIMVRYQGLSYKPKDERIVAEFRKAIVSKDFVAAIANAGPQLVEYKETIHLLGRLTSYKHDEDDYKPVVTTRLLATNEALLFRLKIYGFLKDENRSTETTVQAAVKSAQRMFGQNADGKLTKAILQALNVSIQARIDELKDLLNTLRWLNDLKQSAGAAIINLPSATLMVYQEGKVTLHSKLIVGKPSTPTPTLTSTITQITLYPYWNVPHSIAVKELLPAIKRNPAFIEQNNFQILNRAGAVVNPAHINWKSLNAGNFTFKIRQSTGCDNSLGIIKFNFRNPFTVYLHDTPAKGLFYLNKRFFSHGCMRVEKPVELARLLLQKDQATVDELTKQCLREQKPVVLQLPQAVPVVVVYSTAWYSEKEGVSFYPDVYSKRATTKVVANATASR